jgi:hypothetical protein
MLNSSRIQQYVAQSLSWFLKLKQDFELMSTQTEQYMICNLSFIRKNI